MDFLRQELLIDKYLIVVIYYLLDMLLHLLIQNQVEIKNQSHLRTTEIILI